MLCAVLLNKKTNTSQATEYTSKLTNSVHLHFLDAWQLRFFLETISTGKNRQERTWFSKQVRKYHTLGITNFGRILFLARLDSTLRDPIWYQKAIQKETRPEKSANYLSEVLEPDVAHKMVTIFLCWKRSMSVLRRKGLPFPIAWVDNRFGANALQQRNSRWRSRGWKVQVWKCCVTHVFASARKGVTAHAFLHVFGYGAFVHGEVGRGM